MLLFEVLARTRAMLFWVHAGLQVADGLTKCSTDCKGSLDALQRALSLGCLRISYDTESYRKALLKEKAALERLDYQNLNICPDDPGDFDVLGDW